jgi:hypothetical protein
VAARLNTNHTQVTRRWDGFKHLPASRGGRCEAAAAFKTEDRLSARDLPKMTRKEFHCHLHRESRLILAMGLPSTMFPKDKSEIDQQIDLSCSD